MIWFIYCWRGVVEDDDPSYLTQIEQVAGQSEDNGNEVCVERMGFDVGKRLWDQMVNKIFELKAYSKLSIWDSCLFCVSRIILPGDAFLEEEAYALDHASDYPKGTFPCIGLMYL